MLYQKLNPLIRLACIVVGIAVVLLGWHIAVEAGWVNSLLLPSPSSVAAALVEMARTQKFWSDLSATIVAWALGVILGTVIGAILGFALGLNAYVWAAAEPWVEFFRALPSVVLVPLMSLFFGIGTNSRLACGTLVVAVLMASTASTAIRATRGTYLRLAVAWHASLFRTIRSFYFPAMLSHLAITLKAAIPLALIVTVAADMLIATDSGIGRILMDSLAVFDTRTLYAGVIVVGALGYLSVGITSLLERKTIHWSGS
ncbi:MAG TPA: ABC transporter permease subunit [Verrucomicrobiae bacterium]|nr:ABC transporter permease subunit [Verrucomicrobiae bacterium]